MERFSEPAKVNRSIFFASAIKQGARKWELTRRAEEEASGRERSVVKGRESVKIPRRLETEERRGKPICKKN